MQRNRRGKEISSLPLRPQRFVAPLRLKKELQTTPHGGTGRDGFLTQRRKRSQREESRRYVTQASSLHLCRRAGS